MDNVLVTVIVPVYNVEHWLPRCLDDIAAQTYTHLEVLLVDDGSTDGSGNIALERADEDSRFEVIDKPNGGLSSARNAALDVAHGEWLMMVDGDDTLPPTAVADLLAAATSTGVDVAVGQWDLFDDGTEPSYVTSNEPVRLLTPDEAIDAIFYQDGTLTGSACARLFSRHLFDTLRFPDGRIYEDIGVAYPLYASAKHGIAVCPSTIYGYRQRRKGSILNNFTPRRADVLDGLEALANDLEQRGETAHLPAVNARLLAASLNLLTLSPSDSEYDALRKRCMDNVKRLRRGCIADKRVRRADRMAAVASFAGQWLLRTAGRLVK